MNKQKINLTEFYKKRFSFIVSHLGVFTSISGAIIIGVGYFAYRTGFKYGYRNGAEA